GFYSHAILYTMHHRRRIEAAQMADLGDDLFDDEINFLLGIETAQAEADAAVGQAIGHTQGPQDITGLDAGGGAGRTAADGDVLEGHEQSFPVDVGEAEIQISG